MRRHLALLLTAFILVTGSGVWVLADNADRTINYRGRLEHGGTAVDGTRTFVFRFFATESGGTRIGNEFIYNGVTVASGAFSVALGPLPDAVLATDPLYLEVGVGTSSSDTVVLGTRQRIFAAPFAMRGRGDTSFIVDRAMQALNGLTVNGPLTVSNVLTIGVDANSSGPRTIEFARNPGDEVNAGKISYRGFGAAALSLIGAGSSVRVVKVWDDLQVQRNVVLNAGGTINAQATGWCDCQKSAERESNGAVVADYYAGGEAGSDYYQCRGGRFLVGMWFNCTEGTYCIEQFKCCRPCALSGY